MKNTQVARLLAFVTGMVNQQLLLQNEYLVAENRTALLYMIGTASSALPFEPCYAPAEFNA